MKTKETVNKKKRYISPAIEALPIDTEGLMNISAGGSGQEKGEGGNTVGGDGDAKQSSSGLVNYFDFNDAFIARQEQAELIFDEY